MLYELSFILMYFITIVLLFFIIKRFMQGEINGYIFIIPIFVFFYILPSFIDLLLEEVFLGPEFSATAAAALNDETTNIIYNFYASIIMLIFYVFSKLNKAASYNGFQYSIERTFDKLKKYQLFLLVIIFTPIFLVVLSGDFSFYGEYSQRDRRAANSFQELATKFSVISIVLISLLIVERINRFNKNNNIVHILLIILLLIFFIINSYIHGKRSVVALFVFLMIGTMFITKVVSRTTLIKVILAFTIVFYSFLTFYGKNIGEGASLLEVAQGLRIDLSRDYTLKFVIYHELLNNETVLPFPGASYIFLLTFFIPRSIWEEKPYPYAVYLTNSFFGDFGGDFLYGWGLTTSFVSEAVSNFGFFGLIFFPLFYVFCLKKVDKINNLGLRALAYLIMTLLLLIHPIAIWTLILLFFALCFFNSFKFVLRLRR